MDDLRTTMMRIREIQKQPIGVDILQKDARWMAATILKACISFRNEWDTKAQGYSEPTEG